MCMIYGYGNGLALSSQDHREEGEGCKTISTKVSFDSDEIHYGGSRRSKGSWLTIQAHGYLC